MAEYEQQVAYLERLRGLLADLSEYVPSGSLADAERRVEAGEGPIAMTTAAWTIVETGSIVPERIVAIIRDLIDGTTEANQLPPDLANHVGGGPA